MKLNLKDKANSKGHHGHHIVMILLLCPIVLAYRLCFLV